MTSEPQRTDDQVSARMPIARALVSVYDKAGLDELVRGLADAGVELVSTGRLGRAHRRRSACR